MCTVIGTEEEALETSIKEKKMLGSAWEEWNNTFFPPFSTLSYSMLKFHLFPDVKQTTLIFHLLSYTINSPENKHCSANLQGLLFLNTCDSLCSYSDLNPN